MKLTLTYLGEDFWARPVYKDEDGHFFKDLNLGRGVIELCTSPSFDGEPFANIQYIEKYKNAEIEITNPPQIQNRENLFNYQMLGRLKNDCEYFLGYGKRNINTLWGYNIEEHINEMKRIYGELNEKPEWLTMEEVESYKTKMLAEEK